jgi:hypothetical protein
MDIKPMADCRFDGADALLNGSISSNSTDSGTVIIVLPVPHQHMPTMRIIAMRK